MPDEASSSPTPTEPLLQPPVAAKRRTRVEKGLLGQTVDALRTCGHLAWPQVDLENSVKGAANVGGVVDARALQILVLPIGSPSMAQSAWLDMCVQHGAFAALVRDEAEMKAAVDRIRDLGSRARSPWQWTGNPARIPKKEGR